jgi:titin
LEDRTTPSTFTVMNTLDSGSGSLRDAIQMANAASGAASINFNIPTIDPGFQSGTNSFLIQPLTPLPNITDSAGVIIDGWSQPGFAGTPLIELDGAGASNANGLVIQAPNTTVRGLDINRFAGSGIYVASASNTWINGDYIGTDVTGEVAMPNGSYGVDLEGAPDNTIGGTAPGDRNVILGLGVNNGSGIRVNSSNNTTIQGNYLGTDATGSNEFTLTHNSDTDIYASNSSNLNIQDNVISGGGYFGIDLYPNDDHATIQGNRIGTNAAGTAALGNTYGIYMIGGIHDIQIGGTTPGSGNLISGNAANGLQVASQDCYNITVQGNFIGTDVKGTRAIPNGAHGVVVGGGNILIGGTVLDASGNNISGNLISGNSADGVAVGNASGSQPVLIEGNRIGTNITGSQAIGNSAGVELGFGGGFNTTVGGTDPAARNLISGNSGPGVAIYNSTVTNDLVEGNYIGTDATGSTAVPNGIGVALGGADGAKVIGNVISGNGSGPGYRSGVAVYGTSNSIIQGNKIGTDWTGNLSLPNQGAGVILIAADSNDSIGGILSGQGNVISSNLGGGVEMQYPDNYNNFVQGNFIGTNAAGTSIMGTDGKPLGNGSFGVLIYQGHDNTIGGPGAGNVISGNQGDGIDIAIPTATGNVVQGNFIGTDVGGDNLHNTGNGVFVSGVNNEAIGGVAAGAGNMIAYNGGDGVSVANANSVSILGNSIHDNGGLGINLGAGANNNQAAPVLTAATRSGTGTTISGTLTSLANTTFRIEFFSNQAPDPSGYGEGQTYLGFATVTTDGNGNASFTASLSSPVPQGQHYLSATATDAAGNTSELAADIVVKTALTVVTNTSLMLAGNSPPPLTGSVNGTGFTGTINYTTANGDIITVTLSTAATASSPVGQYAITATLSGANAGAYVIDPSTSRSGTMYVVSIGADPTSTTGAKSVVFWDNKGNRKLITAADLSSLDALNLVNQGGADFDPKAVAQLQAWLSTSPNATTAYQLAVQLAAMDLNVLAGYVHATDLVFAGALLPYAGVDAIGGLTSGGFIDVQNLLNDANNVLGLVNPGASSGSDPNTAYEAALAQVLQAANGNSDFVQQEVPWNLVSLYLLGQLS